MLKINPNLREKHIIGVWEPEERMVSAQICSGLGRRGIYLAGISHADSSFFFARQAPASCQVLVCLGGSGLVLSGGEWLRCEPGMAYLTPIGKPHAYRAAPDSSVWEIAWVLYAGAAGGLSDPLSHLEMPLVTEVNPEPLAEVIRGLYDEAMNGAADPGILEEWASLLDAQARRIAQPSGMDSRLRRLWATVAADPAHRLDNRFSRRTSRHKRRTAAAPLPPRSPAKPDAPGGFLADAPCRLAAGLGFLHD